MTEDPPRTSFVEAWLTRITQHPLLTLSLCVLAAVAAAWIAADSLGVNSDAIDMLDEDLPFRQTDERLRSGTSFGGERFPARQPFRYQRLQVNAQGRTHQIGIALEAFGDAHLL